MVVVGSALVAGALVVLSVLRTSLVDNIRDAATLRAGDVASALESGTDPNRLVSGIDDNTQIQVVDAHGTTIAATPEIVRRDLSADVPARGHASVRIGGDHELFLAVSRHASTPIGAQTVIVARTLEPVGESTRVVALLFLIGVPLLIALVGFTTWRLVGRAQAPVERMRARQRQFVADASHELRSPIASIREQAEVAAAHPDRTTTRALAEHVGAESRRMQRLVDDLLLLARADEQSLALRQRPVDLDDIVFDGARELRRDASPLRVDTTRVSPARVLGDEAALARIVGNLAENAARHARTAVAFALAEHAGAVVLDIDDDGTGVPAVDRARVFERFVRLDDARARDDGGSGLGLAIVAQLVTAHGGEVEILDSPLGGARVEVRLPGFDPDAQRAPATRIASSARSTVSATARAS
jgi:signal transduction histidine kinase